MRCIKPKVGTTVMLVCALLPVGSAAAADEFSSIVDQSFDLVEKGKTDKTLDTLYENNPWASRATDAMQQVKTRLKNITAMAGTYHGRELVVEKQLGSRFVYIYHLVYYDRQPVRFEFQFYKPTDSWTTYQFSFDTDPEDTVVSEGRRAAVRDR